MKIIKQGNSAVPLEKPWWIGKEAVCGRCTCVVLLEKGDSDKIPKNVDRETGIITAISFLCPTCSHSIVLLRNYDQVIPK